MFSRGNIARLKSGGPDMTVTKVREPSGHTEGFPTGEQAVFCEWFEGNRLRERIFPSGLLINQSTAATPAEVNT